MATANPMPLSLAQQAMILRSRFPESRADLERDRVSWTGTIRPTPCSRDYKVMIVYRWGRYPHVTVVDPSLQPDPGDPLPHTYRDGSLCLHLKSEWNSGMAIADTIVPWAAEWLAHYEIWKVRRCWYGDDHPGTNQTPTSPDQEEDNRGSRRRRQRRRSQPDHRT